MSAPSYEQPKGVDATSASVDRIDHLSAIEYKLDSLLNTLAPKNEETATEKSPLTTTNTFSLTNLIDSLILPERKLSYSDHLKHTMMSLAMTAVMLYLLPNNIMILVLTMMVMLIMVIYIIVSKRMARTSMSINPDKLNALKQRIALTSSE